MPMIRTLIALAVSVALLFMTGGSVTAQALPEPAAPPLVQEARGTNVFGALVDSMKLLAIEHGIRIGFQPKTRRELGGPFWSDYRRSIRWPSQWEDSDSWAVNYVGHPIHGAAAGIIWLDHGPDENRPIGDKRYWGSRARAAAFSAVYSLQFEIGPLSEASIGNVGMRPETTGWVDHVVTPAGAFGFMIAEDALDRYFVEWVERRVDNRVVRGILRVMFHPSRTFANVVQMRAPWHRPDRPLGN